jgi:hypothetical protein
MMQAANSLSHAPGQNWPCHTAAGAAAAGASNLALSGASMGGGASIDLYMSDSGQGNAAVGHRRWILNPTQSGVAVGHTARGDALYVMNQNLWQNPRPTGGVAWPAAGYFPYHNLPGSKRWSYTDPSVAFQNRTVTVTKNGVPVDTAVIYADGPSQGYAYPDSTIVWTMPAITPPQGAAVDVYNVQISGVASYEVKLFNAARITFDSVTVTSPGAVGSQVTATAVTTPAAAADHVTWTWYRDGAVIPGATSSVHTISEDDVGAALSVQAAIADGAYRSCLRDCQYVVNTMTDWVGAVKSSDPVTVPMPPLESVIVSPAAPGPGALLTATASPPVLQPTYQWYRDGQAIPEATGATYRVTGADLCAQLMAQATADGATETSDAVQPSFTDVPADHLFFTSICWAANRGITVGSGDGTTYAPSAPVNRGSMAAFLYRLAGSPLYTPPAVSPFADVPVKHLFYKPINWLYDNGITVGVTVNGKLHYQPSNAVNRGSMSAFLYRLAGHPQHPAPAAPVFSDVATTHTFYRTISWLSQTGITTGCGADKYCPSNPVNRGSMSAFMQRFDRL